MQDSLKDEEFGKGAAHFYADHHREEMHQFLPPMAQTLLDVGCHRGGFASGLKVVRNIEIWGVEPNSDAANLCSDSVDHLINGHFDSSIELPDNYFDVIVFNDVLEHIEDPWEVLKFAQKKLAEGGCLVVSLPNMLHIDNILHLIRDRDFAYEEWGVRDKTHLRFFTRKSARQMFESCGYIVTLEQGVNPMWWTKSLVRRLAFRILPGFLNETKFIQNAFVLKRG